MPTSRRGRWGGGCPADAGRRKRHRGEGEAVEKRRQRCNTRSTFETSGCNTCNIYLKADETHETCIWNTRSTFEACRWNTCYIRTKELKHSKHAYETFAKKTPKDTSYVWKYMQHLDQNACNICLETDETVWTNTYNMSLKTLATCATSPDLLSQHQYKTICNMPLKRLKQLKRTFAT
jgi:hypothetical protein